MCTASTENPDYPRIPNFGPVDRLTENARRAAAFPLTASAGVMDTPALLHPRHIHDTFTMGLNSVLILDTMIEKDLMRSNSYVGSAISRRSGGAWAYVIGLRKLRGNFCRRLEVNFA